MRLVKVLGISCALIVGYAIVAETLTLLRAQQPTTGQAAAAAAREGQPPMGGIWGFRAAVDPDPSLPWMLLVGDSVTNGYGPNLTAQLRGKVNVDMWITPAWLGPELFQAAPNILQMRRYQLIHFNESGLHAWAPGRIPDGQYGPLMRDYLQLLHHAAPQAKLIWATTTPVTMAGSPGKLDQVNSLIADRNKICKAIMEEKGIPIDDLYAVLFQHLDLAVGDRFHWKSDAYELLAEAAATTITSELKGNVSDNAIHGDLYHNDPDPLVQLAVTQSR
jgi:hypothetical protein